VASSALPLEAGAFPASGLVLSFPTNAPSSLAYRASGMYPPGVRALAGVATNRAPTLATLTTEGQRQILRVPIDAQYVLSLIAANDTTVDLLGTVVAVRLLPVAPRFESIAVTNQIVTLRWQGTPGEAYVLQSTGDFQAWQALATNLTSSTGDQGWSGPVSADPHFFRLCR
jgi:hypothetical protein